MQYVLTANKVEVVYILELKQLIIYSVSICSLITNLCLSDAQRTSFSNYHLI